MPWNENQNYIVRHNQPGDSQTIFPQCSVPSGISDCLSPDLLDAISNSNGQIRRALVYNAFMDGLLSISDVEAVYLHYREESEYMCLYGIDNGTTYSCLDGNKRSFFENSHWFFAKCSKRGNDVYESRVKDKFSWLKNVEDVKYFDQNSRDLKQSPLLLITLTYDISRCSLAESWQNIGNEYNSFKSSMAAAFGKISWLRTWESREDGYAHVHVLAFFHDCQFSARRHVNKDGRVTWRVPLAIKKKIAGYWHSFVDVQACYSTGAVRYATKYIIKDLWQGSCKTAAMLWLFNKQSYSCPHSFVENVFSVENARLDYNMHNSKYSYVFVGIFSNSMLHFHPSMWFLTFDKPPPWILPALLQAFEDNVCSA